ncbi:MAG: hypothetical protein AAF675_14430 [Pseudomonadota bacterium]
MPRPIHAALLALTLGLSACADGALYETTDIPPGPPPYPLAEGPEITLELGLPTPDAKPFVEEVAARCWLDGVLQADAMIVERASGRIVLTGASEDLLVVDFIPYGVPENLARLRLSGAAMTNEEQSRRLIEHLERAERGGEIACPALDPDAPVTTPMAEATPAAQG